MAEALDLAAEEYVAVPLPAPVGGVASAYPPNAIQDHQLASASNFLIRDGVVTKRKGYETLIGQQIGSPPYTLREFTLLSPAEKTWLVCGTVAGFFYYDATAGLWVDNTNTAGRTVNVDVTWFTDMRTETAGLLLLSGNGVDALAQWAGATGAGWTVTSTACIGRAGIAWRSHLLQGDVTTPADGRIGARVQWSALGSPQVWTGTASTSTLDLTDGNASKIHQFVPMRSTLLAYKERGVHALGYKGHPFYFTQGLLHGDMSTISRRSVVPIKNGDQHFVVSDENLLLWDGSNLEFIGTPILREFYDSINWSRRQTVWAAYNAPTEEVLVGIPTGASQFPNVVWVYNLRYQSWWKLSLPFIGALDVQQVFTPRKLLAWNYSTNKLYELFSGYGDGTGATAISASLQTKAYDFGTPAAQKRLKHVGAYLGTGTSGTTASVSLARWATENPTATAAFDTATTITATGGTKENKFDGQVSGKFLSFRVTHTAANETVAVHTLTPYVQGRTTRRKERS